MTFMRNGYLTSIPLWESAFTQDGKIIFIMPAVENLKVGDVVECGFRLVMPPGSVFAGDEVIPTLHSLREQVARTVEAFTVLCSTRLSAVTKFDEPKISVGKSLIIASANPGSPAAEMARQGQTPLSALTQGELDALLASKIIPKGFFDA